VLEKWTKEKNFYNLFYRDDDGGADVRREYTQNLPKFENDFREGMEALEKLMREHIEGKKLN
jgi:hypothetical protein